VRPSRVLLAGCLTILCGLTGIPGAVRGQSASKPPPALADSISQPSPSVHLTEASLSRFEDAFAALTAQGKAAFVAEGTPLRTELDADALSRLRDDLKPFTDAKTGAIPLEDAIRTVALAYDYEAVPSGPTLYLLLKRYSDPEDIPYITSGEATACLRNILRATEPFSPKDERELLADSALTHLLRSFMPAEGSHFTVKKRVSELTSQQRTWAWEWLRQKYLSYPQGFIERVYYRLKGIEDERAAFLWREYIGVRVFIYEGPFTLPRTTTNLIRSVALSHGFFTGAGGAVQFPPRGPDATYLNDKIVGGVKDPTAPLPPPVLPLIAPLSSAATLRQVAERLSAKDKAFQAVVDEELGPKPVCLIGADALPARQIWEAVAAVYGLRVVQPQAGIFRMTLQNPRVLKDLDEIPGEIRRLLPTPLIRVADGGAGTMTAKLQEIIKTHSDPELARRFANATPDAIQREARREAMRVLYRNAVRRLRAIVQPKVPDEPNARLPIRETGDDVKCLIAVSSLATLVEYLDALQKPVPGYIREFDRVELEFKVTMQPNGTNIEFFFAGHDKQGKGTGGQMGSMGGPVHLRP
jgi:hypothetical protein